MLNMNEMQTIKRRFFAMRNGIVADALRRAGSQFRIIFGLNFPQLREIADDLGHRPDLAAELWKNRSTRESLMLAPMLWRPTDFSTEELASLCATVPDAETADIVAMRLISAHSSAADLAIDLTGNAVPLMRYLGLRTLLRLVGTIDDNRLLDIANAEIERDESLTRLPASLLRDAVSW